jgi:hypothetical protein
LKLSQIIVLIVAISCLQIAHANDQPIRGRVLNRAGQPLPGCIVFVASEKYRTPPAITDSNGEFQTVVTIGGTEEEYVEVYWGQTLMYRKPLQIPNLGLNQIPVPQIPAIILGR